jgi:hypothetical protein
MVSAGPYLAAAVPLATTSGGSRNSLPSCCLIPQIGLEFDALCLLMAAMRVGIRRLPKSYVLDARSNRQPCIVNVLSVLLSSTTFVLGFIGIDSPTTMDLSGVIQLIWSILRRTLQNETVGFRMARAATFLQNASAVCVHCAPFLRRTVLLPSAWVEGSAVKRNESL